jgi:DNA gyrase subunit A
LTNQIDVIDEVQQNFIDSSYDVNTNRAFPDVRDGLKPSMRACLWEMYVKGYTSNKPHVKSAKIDGGVAALFWPHGTVSIYETFTRMSQPFSNNIPEVDFHGSNGNVILGGDAIAADRYTEARLAKITEEGMLQGINKNNVDMILNFSEDEWWPKVLPAVFPRLLVNGSQGIGVSLSQQFTLHNFTETANLILDYIKTGNLNENEYYPDFPTGGTIINKDDLAAINKTGTGKVIVEANYEIKGQDINFYEMPFQVYIELVIEQIKDALEKNKISGIKDVSNRSEKNSISLLVECQKGVEPRFVVNQLFQATDLCKQYNIIQNGIISKTPTLLTLKQIVDVYIEHNIECIKREHQYDYDKAVQRIHILDGLLVALDKIDTVIALIRSHSHPEKSLMELLGLDEIQVKSILDMKLAKLSKLEEDKLEKEKKEKEEIAAKCKKVIESTKEQKKVLSKRLSDLAKKYGSDRKTKVIQKEQVKITKAPKEVVPEDVAITFTRNGYIKSIPLKLFRRSKNNITEFKSTTQDMILLFSNFGKMYKIKTSKIKQCGNTDKGIAAGSLLSLSSGEKILNISAMGVDENKPYIIFFTKNGLVKKTNKEQYISNTQSVGGIVVLKLDSSDEVIGVYESNGDIGTIATKNGIVLSFDMETIKEQGKTAKGVKAITLVSDMVTLALISPPGTKTILINDKECNIKKQKRAGKGNKLFDTIESLENIQ